MKMVKLRNGTKTDEVLVRTVMVSLNNLGDGLDASLLAYDLMECARNRSYVPFGDNGERLVRLGLLENANGMMHDSIRNIVVSASRGEGIDAVLGNPLAE